MTKHDDPLAVMSRAIRAAIHVAGLTSDHSPASQRAMIALWRADETCCPRCGCAEMSHTRIHVCARCGLSVETYAHTDAVTIHGA